MPKLTRAEEVLKILSDNQWHSIVAFHNPQTGSSGDRRLRELRQKGYPIIKRKIKGSMVCEYRLQTLREVYEQYFPESAHKVFLNMEEKNEREESSGTEREITTLWDSLPSQG